MADTAEGVKREGAGGLFVAAEQRRPEALIPDRIQLLSGIGIFGLFGGIRGG